MAAVQSINRGCSVLLRGGKIYLSSCPAAKATRTPATAARMERRYIVLDLDAWLLFRWMKCLRGCQVQKMGSCRAKDVKVR